MTSNELRERFLAFFKAKDHPVIPSDSLIPSGDPTVLFTSAGMNQFKDYFLGKRTDLKRAASCQKCLRTGDLEKVGKTPSHHSFFEMLGNFSFGDYFKREAITWGWEFLTGLLPEKKLWVSIYEEDDDAFALWRKIGLPESRIKRFGQADNFWPANAPTEGPNGPCGPCSEIYYDPDGKVQGSKSVEVWNLVFTQYDRQPDGTLKPLPKPNIDTGMGLERLAAVVQGVETDYETDLFQPIIDTVSRFARAKKVNLGNPTVMAAQRTVADHIRAIVFLVSEGLIPSNEKQGYVLRMLIRRTSMRMQEALDIGFYRNDLVSAALDLATSVEMAMGQSPYAPGLFAKHEVVRQVLSKEIMQFQGTVRTAVDRLGTLIARVRQANQTVIPGKEAFELYDTYGLPFELTQDLASERGLTVDRTGFDAARQQQQERSRAGSQFGGDVFIAPTLKLSDDVKPEFIGYQALQAEARVKGIWHNNQWIQQAKTGEEVGIVLDRSPFYGESGGQIGDQGLIESPKGAAEILDTKWVDELLVHRARVKQGTVSVNDPVRTTVDAERRLKVARSHTAAHVLHWALRTVLGPETVQAGSLVELERVRFDFSSLSGLHEEQQAKVEQLVNERARCADDVKTTTMGLEDAKHMGALALFGEKYGRQVRVVSIGDYSKELCGGTHLSHTGLMGSFRIVAESSIAAGTRRIEALVGEAAQARQHQEQRLLAEAARRLSRPPQELLGGLEELLSQLKRSEQQRKAVQAELATVEAKRLTAEAKQIQGVAFIAANVKQADREVLAVMADALRHSLKGDGVVVLAASEGGSKVSLVVAVTGALVKHLSAGELLKAVAPLVQGSGGGRPEFAQGGGKDPSKIPDVFKRAEEIVRQTLRT